MKILPVNNRKYLKCYEGFQKAIIAQGYSTSNLSTIAAREFLFYLEAKDIMDIKKVKVADVIAYYEYLKERPNQKREGGLDDSSIRHYMYVLRLFFDHLLKTGQVKSSPAILPTFQFIASKDRNILTEEEMHLLYATAKNPFERALLSVAYGCGLRRTELVRLDVGDILFSKGMVNIRKGKGNKPRTVPATDKIISDLKEYLVYERAKKVKPHIKSNAFFISKYGLRMCGENINYRLKMLAERTGNQSIISKDISLHTLRHSIATHLMDKGAEMEFVKNFLGHSLLDTTHIYSKKRKQRMKFN